MRRRWGALLAALALGACAPPPPALPPAPVPADGTIDIRAEPVTEHPPGASRVTACPAAPCGEWTYAGGLHLTSLDTSRLHGLSDLEVAADGRLTAVSDEGDLLTARIVLDAAGRLVGVTDGRIAPLRGPDGEPLAGKEWGDAEGLAVAPGGLLVSFEHHHRVLFFPHGGRAIQVSSPEADFPLNGGMEALSIGLPEGEGAYLTAGEDSGETWICWMAAGCTKGPTLDKPSEFGVVAVRVLPRDRRAWLLRAWDPLRGNRVELRITDRDLRTLEALRIAPPATVDNFEGLAALPRPDGSVRFYLISDDNFSPSQRTLLLAFDWRPPVGR